MVNLELDRCTKDPETCPVVERVFEADEFYWATESLGDGATELRSMLATFVVACVRGKCPGRAPERLGESYINRSSLD